MGTFDRTEFWDKNDIQIIKRTIPSNRYVLGNSFEFKYSTKTPITNELLVFSFNSFYNVFVVWNASIHKKYFIGESHTLSVGRHIKQIIEKARRIDTDILPYTKIIDVKTGATETFFVLGKNALYEFCSNYLEYLSINDSSSFSYTENHSEIHREYETIERKKRNPNFRKKILEKYNSTCMICGCKEPNILEAAHIVSVAENGPDDESNGYCLCANHHRLFDSCRLFIDEESKSFSCKNTSETEAPWYKEAEKRDFKLILPQEEK